MLHDSVFEGRSLGRVFNTVAPAFRDVPEDPLNAGDPPLGVMNRCLHHLNVDDVTVGQLRFSMKRVEFIEGSDNLAVR